MKLLHFRTRNKIHNVIHQNVPGPLFSQGEEEEEDWDAEEKPLRANNNRDQKITRCDIQNADYSKFNFEGGKRTR